MRDAMRTKGWFISIYTATSRSRSQGFYDYMMDMDAGKAKLDEKLATIDELKSQLMIHTYEMNDRLEPVVLQKKKIKEILGHSPDEADSAMIANWVRRGGSSAHDPKQDQSRIIF